MSALHVSAPHGVLNSSTITSSPTFGQSPSPAHRRSSVQSPRRVENTPARQDIMDHEPTSPPNGAEFSAPHSEDGTNSVQEGEGHDEMQVDENDIPGIPVSLPTLPPMSQLLSGFDVETREADLPIPNFGTLPPIQALENQAQDNHDVQGWDTDLPIPSLPQASGSTPNPLPDTTQPLFASNPPPPTTGSLQPPPPPVMDEEEDDFDAQASFLRHFQEDPSEIPAEQLEEMTRQERSGGRNLQLSGLQDDHWIKQVETSIDDPAFVPKEQGKYTWHLDQFHGTKENPCRERIVRSPEFTIGGYKWNIKLFPHGCEGTDYVSIYLECGGKVVSEEESWTAGPWDVAAQIGCVMYNPNEPRTHHFERASHHFETSNPDWGWVRFYGPWQELHLRRFLEYRPMLQNDKISITAYIRVWDDPTKLLWSPKLKNGQWDSFKQTGFRGLVADSTAFTAYTSALSLLFHCSDFNKMIAAAPWDDPVRQPQRKRSPLIQELKRTLYHWHNPEMKTGPESISGVQWLVSWYGYKFDGSTDIIQIWTALSHIIALEQSNIQQPGSEDSSSSTDGGIVLVRDRPSLMNCAPNPDVKEYKSVQEIFNQPTDNNNNTNTNTKAWKNLFRSTTATDDNVPGVIAIELKRSKFDTKKRKWGKLTHHIKIDQKIVVNSTSYYLRGAVIHRGELGSGDFYSVVRPQDSANWLKYRNAHVSYLTNKQAVDIHEGKGEGKISTDSIAYVLMYSREDDSTLVPTRETLKEQGIVASLERTSLELRPDETIPIIIHDSKDITSHQGLGFVDPWTTKDPNMIVMNMRASAILGDVQGELLDRLKATNRAERKEQIRLWPITTSRDAPRFVLELDADERWPDTLLLEFVAQNGGAHLWLHVIPLDMLELDNESKPEPMETSTSNLQVTQPMTTSNETTDVIMTNTEDEASEGSSERNGEDEDEDEDNGSSESNHSDWALGDCSYVILKTWNPQLLRLSCQGAYFVPELKDNILDFVRKTLKVPSSQKLKVYQETGSVLEAELSYSAEFHKLNSQAVVLVVSPELPDKVQEQRRKAGEPVTASDWYKIMQDRRDPAYKHPSVIKDFFGGPYILYSTTPTQPRRKSIVVDTKGDAFAGDLDLNWVKNGTGTMVYANGNRYDGEWRDDLTEGRGTMIYHPSGNKYEGGWLAGRRHGKGVMHYEQSEDQLRTCKICYEEEMNTVLVKCGHIVACHICAKELRDCPVCRRTVQDIVRMWPTV